MKKLLMTFAVVGMIFFLAACGNNDSNDVIDGNGSPDVNNTTENNDMNDNADTDSEADDSGENTGENNTADNSSDGTMMDKMKELAIEEIEIEVEYADHKQYEIEIEKDSHSDEGYEAELDDDLNEEYLKGQEAFDKLYPMVKALDIDENTSKDDAISQVLEVFDLPDNYEEIEIEIDLWDFEHEIEFEEEK